MSNAAMNSDVRNLFRRFGGDASHYQEIHQGCYFERARSAWPIVKAMENSRGKSPIHKRASDIADAHAALASFAVHSSQLADVSDITLHLPAVEVASRAHQDLGGLRALEVAALGKSQPVIFGRDGPLSLVFVRLLGVIRLPSGVGEN